MLLALVLMPVQLMVTAPYGRHNRTGWGVSIDNRLGWTLMESVSLLAIWSVFLLHQTGIVSVALLALGLWSLHYGYRAFIYPWRTRTRYKQMPLVVVAFAAIFNLVNGGFNGYFLGNGWLQNGTPSLSSWHTWIGTMMFVLGWLVNFSADNTLLSLRKSDDAGYQIPRGRLFKYVSCPNFLGELIIWTGFAVLCWNLAAIAFVVWTAANLIPRAIAHHRWYVATFADYPRQRRAIIPFFL
jgi:steroid 5-alpha reductase family enzyme